MELLRGDRVGLSGGGGAGDEGGGGLRGFEDDEKMVGFGGLGGGRPGVCGSGVAYSGDGRSSS